MRSVGDLGRGEVVGLILGGLVDRTQPGVHGVVRGWRAGHEVVEESSEEALPVVVPEQPGPSVGMSRVREGHLVVHVGGLGHIALPAAQVGVGGGHQHHVQTGRGPLGLQRLGHLRVGGPVSGIGQRDRLALGDGFEQGRVVLPDIQAQILVDGRHRIELSRLLGVLAPDLLDQPGTVDGGPEGDAEVRIVGGRHVRVQMDPGLLQHREANHLEAVAVLEGTHGRDGLPGDDVEIAALQLQDLGHRVGDDPDLDSLIERLLSPVVLVAGQHVALPEGELLDHIGACAG